MKSIFWITLLVTFAGSLSGQVFVDQAGYSCFGEKRFWTNISSDSFSVLEAGSQTEVFRDELHFFTANDPATGMALYTGDFSALQIAGQFLLQLHGGATSAPVNISDTVYHPVFRKSLRGFYYQRCGMNLTGTFAGNYYHPACHTVDATFHGSSGFSGFRYSIGGWHDAGDYGKYSVNGAVSVATLLMAYEWFPHLFSDDNLNIPESGDGIPDILNESRYELEWLLKMQDSDGGVFHKLTAEQFPPFIMPQYHSDPRFIYQKSSTATADFAAVAARAARVFAPFDSTFAADCRAAAILAWQYLQNHPTIIPPGGFQNPPGTNTGEYSDDDDRDERLWAAAELFETTAQSTYLNYLQSHYGALGLINGSFWWGDVKALALLTYLKSQRVPHNDALKVQVRNSLNSHCQNLLLRIAGNGFAISLMPGEYYWGCNSTVLNNAIYLLLNYVETENSVYVEGAMNQLHYILGANAHDLSFVTGVGWHSPQQPHHRPSDSDGIVPPVPGLLVGGPDQYLSDPVLQSTFTANTPPALCYIDTVESYASNEIAINWNAPLVFVSGVLRQPGAILGINTDTPAEHPSRIRLWNNYPNPFNGTTKIRFFLRRPEPVALEIYNILGEKIYFRQMGKLPPGYHELVVNFSAKQLGALASGVYLYRLLASSPSEIRKMVYLR